MAETWGVEPDVTLQVLLFAAGPFDNPLFSGGADITSYVRSQGITITRGRSDEFSSFQAGTCTFTLKNNLREFDPTNPSSPFAALLRPLRRIQVIATYAGTAYVLFTGYVEGWPRTWSKVTGSVDIVAHDAIGIMARTTTAQSFGALILDDPHYGRLDHGRLSGAMPVQYTGERALSLIQLAGFTVGAVLDIARGLTRVVDGDPSGNVLQLLQEVETAEAGFFFADRDGAIRFLDRHARFLVPRISDVQAVFTDSDYTDLSVDYDLAHVWNDVTFTRPDGAPQNARDPDSIHDYGLISYPGGGPGELPVLSDGDALGRAEFWRDRYSQPQDRPSPIVIRPRRDLAALLPAVAGRELLDRVQIERTPLGVGDTVIYTELVEQIEHRITNESWETVLATSPIDLSEGDSFLILDDLTRGELDATYTLAY